MASNANPGGPEKARDIVHRLVRDADVPRSSPDLHAPDLRCPISVSPRNAAVAARLATIFAPVRVAANNQAVLEQSEVVFVAVRPQIAREAIAALRFTPEHRVISLVATFSQHTVASLVGPAANVVCAVPLPTVALHQGPTAMFPPDAFAASIFEPLGGAVQAATEAELHALWTATATMATFFRLMQTLWSWLIAHGVPQERARDYVGAMFAGLGLVGGRERASFEELASEFATRGGLNEQCAAELEQAGAFEACSRALDGVLARIERGTAAVQKDSGD